MTEAWALLAPLPKFDLPSPSHGQSLPPLFSIEPMLPELRRALLDAAKEHVEEGVVDNFLMVVSQSNSVVVAEIPYSAFHGLGIAVAGAEYQYVADAGLRRLVDCLRLFTDVPEVFPRSCWFHGELGGPGMRLETLRPVWAEWTLPEIPEMSDIADGLDGVRRHWSTLAKLCRVDQLMACYVAPQKHKGVCRCRERGDTAESRGIGSGSG